MSLKEQIKKIIEPIFNIRNKSYLEKYYKAIDTNENIYNIDDDFSKLKRVLVLAPHQDDETIGLGATISKMKSYGIIVDLIYLTDGRINGDNTNISEIRIQEANKMKDILAIDNMYLIDNINDTLEEKMDYTSEFMINNLKLDEYDAYFFTSRFDCHKDHRSTFDVFINDTLEEKMDYTSEFMINNLKLDEYDAYFFTSRFDCHKDHRSTFDVLVNLCKNNKLKKDSIFYMYDINNSIQGDILNCISMIKNKELSDKWKAYEVFKSQKYITFSTIKIIDNKKLGIANKWKAYEVFKSQKYITFSTIKIIDNKKIGLAKNKGIDISNFEGLECFCRINLEQLINISKIDNSFAKEMNTATSSIKLKKFLEENKNYRNNFKNIQSL